MFQFLEKSCVGESESNGGVCYAYRHDLGTELVPIRLNVKIQGRHIQESFCIDPSAEESYLVHMVKQLCFETHLSRHCEQPLYNIIKDHIHKFKEVSARLESSDSEESIETIR